MAFGINFGKQKQKSSGSTQDFGSEVWGGQSPFLQELYRMGSTMAGGMGGGYAQQPMPQQQAYYPQQAAAPMPQAPSRRRSAFGMMMPGKNARDNAQNRRKAQPAAMPQQMQPQYAPQQPQYAPQQQQSFAPGRSPADPWMASAGRMIGTADKTLTGMQSPTVDPAFQAYSQTLGQQFREQFLPELQGQAAMAGGLGGSRQQIGSALGAQRAMQELGNFGANAYAGQQERSLAAAQAQGQLADFARSMPWYGLQQYAGLLGSPTSLSKGSKGTTKSKGTGFNSGFQLG